MRQYGIGNRAGHVLAVVAVLFGTGRAVAQLTRADEGGDPIEVVPLSLHGQDDGGVAAPGPDMVFCQLYGLQQYGRLGDIVGLAQATTSWNIGGRDLIWFQNPDNRHPFIVSNLYRLKNDRFEQIGMSHVKHGFFALGDSQCGGTCHYEPGHGVGDWLGQGCTDTYSSSLNATQSGLGPRYEMNAWTGGWTYAGSHMSSGHSHNAIQHRLQVRDSDLNPAQNAGALYYSEGYYLTIDDQNPMNNGAWKQVTINSGSPGGNWSFGMSGSGTQPTRGFAVDAWSGARQTTLAQQVPVVRFSSPDGRCVLYAKATELGGNQWHYEYALLNVDMNRKGGSFSIPVPSGTTVTNVGFSAVASHDEPYSNTPWTSTVSSSAVTWSTTNNPLRWATLYNFRFDADAPPGDVVATLGLYEPGTPSSVTGVTTGPLVTVPIADPQADPSGMVKTRFVSVVVPATPSTTAAGASTALRVTLTNLHEVNPPYSGGSAADFSSFEGQFRWVGPPTQYQESASSSETFYASALQCTPHYRDWSTVGLLHITGQGVLPSSVYTIENYAPTCMGNEGTCPDVSEPLELVTGRWGDIVAPYSPPSPTIQPDIADIAALVDKFKNVLGAPIKAQAVIAGNDPDLSQDVDFTQISACVDAFKGLPYPFSGPAICP